MTQKSGGTFGGLLMSLKKLLRLDLETIRLPPCFNTTTSLLFTFTYSHSSPKYLGSSQLIPRGPFLAELKMIYNRLHSANPRVA